MKLRNKKTGEIVEPTSVEWVADDEITFAYTTADDCGKALSYHSLAEFNEEWEDCELTVPKISDAEWRCIVRKWYKLNDLKGLIRIQFDAKNYRIIGWREGEDFDGQEIDIPLNVLDKSIGRMDKYSIDDLCGEEKE